MPAVCVTLLRTLYYLFARASYDVEHGVLCVCDKPNALLSLLPR